MKLWKVGKVKKVFQVSHSELEVESTDETCVFGKVVPTSQRGFADEFNKF